MCGSRGKFADSACLLVTNLVCDSPSKIRHALCTCQYLSPGANVMHLNSEPCRDFDILSILSFYACCLQVSFHPDPRWMNLIEPLPQ